MTLLERQLSEYCEFVDELHGPIRADELSCPRASVSERPRRRGGVWAALGAAAVAVVAIGGVAVLSLSRSDVPATDTPAVVSTAPTTIALTEPQAGDEPLVPPSELTPTTVATMVDRELIPAEWVRASGALPSWGPPGFDHIVSNGSSFLSLGAGGDWFNGALVRSIDGISWEAVASPSPGASYGLIAVDNKYFMDDGTRRNPCTYGDGECSLLVSTDGLEWTSRPMNSDGTIDFDWIWRVQDPSRLSNPPDLEPGDLWESVIMEFPDRLILLGTDHNGGSHRFEFLESPEIGRWTRIQSPPPFAAVLTSEYLHVGWQWMWNCEFTANRGQAMALITTSDDLELWTTRDGIAWNRLPNPPVQPVAPQRGHCIKATSDGWIIAPNAGGPGMIEDFDPAMLATATPGSILFSKDGVVWSGVEFPESVAGFIGDLEVVGDAVFIIDPITGDVLVGTLNPD